jgi:hypothetical protein
MPVGETMKSIILWKNFYSPSRRFFMNKLQVLMMSGLLAVSSVSFAGPVLTMEIFQNGVQTEKDTVKLVQCSDISLADDEPCEVSLEIKDDELSLSLTGKLVENQVVGVLTVVHQNVPPISYPYELAYGSEKIIRCFYVNWFVKLSVVNEDDAQA